jgi:hypothetical protein
MVPGIRFQVNEVRRPERVVRSLASDFRHNSVPYREAELREGFRREVRAADAAVTRPATRPSESSGLAAPNVVPYEVLQQAARGEIIPGYNAPPDELSAIEAELAREEAELGPFEAPTEDDPFGEPERRPFEKSATEGWLGERNAESGEARGDEPANVFERPKEAPPPFGRSIPFDLSATADDEEAVAGKPFAKSEDAKHAREGDVAGFVTQEHDLALAVARGSVLPQALELLGQRLELGAEGTRQASSAEPVSKTQASGVGPVIQSLLENVQKSVSGSKATKPAAQDDALQRTLAQFASQRYQSAEHNEFDNVAALRTDNAQRWSRIGITRPTFALSLTV